MNNRRNLAERKWRRPKPVTIALGYRCHNGVILAADTLVIMGDHEAHEGTKLDDFWAKSGSFVFVNASNDASATASLIADIRHEIEQHVGIDTYRELGRVVKDQMTNWRRGYKGRTFPAMQMLLGVKLKARASEEPKLFLCDPPNTFREIEDYFAIGYGASVTDHVYSYLFSGLGGGWCDAQTILRRIAYMVYRAKKDNAVVGKNTDTAIVHDAKDWPTTVEQGDMTMAEGACHELDTLLAVAGQFALESKEERMDFTAVDVKHIRSTVFHDHRGDIITARKGRA